MSKENEQLKGELSFFAGRFAPPVLLPAKVLSYNSNDDTVSVQLNDATIDDVRLRSVVKDGNKIVMVPKVSSIVLIAAINNSRQYFVIAVEEIDKEVMQIGNVKFEIDSTGFLLQKNTASLKQILTNIIQATQQILVVYGNNPDYTKLAQALTDVDNLLR